MFRQLSDKLQATGWMVWVSNPSTARQFLSPKPSTPASQSKTIQAGCVVHPAPGWVPGFFPRGKAAGTWCWPLTTILYWGKNEWSYTTTPLICLHSMDRTNFTFLFHFLGLYLVNIWSHSLEFSTGGSWNLQCRPHQEITAPVGVS
jgi:hypothetical protein